MERIRHSGAHARTRHLLLLSLDVLFWFSVARRDNEQRRTHIRRRPPDADRCRRARVDKCDYSDFSGGCESFSSDPRAMGGQRSGATARYSSLLAYSAMMLN